MIISIVIPTLNNLAELRRQVPHLKQLRSDDHELEIIYVDGGSTDGSREFLIDTGFELILEAKPTGVATAVNKGIKIAKGDYIVFLNDDAMFHRYDFDLAVDLLIKDPTIGLLAFYHDFFGSRGVWDILHSDDRDFKIMHYDGIPYANFGMAHRSIYQKLGYMDERYRFMAWDPDFSLRVWEAGLQVRPCKAILLDHPGKDDLKRGLAYNRLRDQTWRDRKKDVKRIMQDTFQITPKIPGNMET